jgi:hypothetical protein
MDTFGAPNLQAAARHLDQANTAIKEAMVALKRPDGYEAWWSLATKLGDMARHLREDRLQAALAVPIVDSKLGAKAMGASRSEKKLAALAKARAAKAEKDQMRRLTRELARRRGYKAAVA